MKQGVKLLSYPVNVEAAPTQDKIGQKIDDMVATTRVPNCVEVSSSFDSATGEISVDTSFGFLESWRLDLQPRYELEDKVKCFKGCSSCDHSGLDFFSSWCKCEKWSHLVLSMLGEDAVSSYSCTKITHQLLFWEACKSWSLLLAFKVASPDTCKLELIEECKWNMSF